MEVGFMIRDKNTGLFSSGTGSPKFRKNGKIWSSIGRVKSHLRLFEVHHWDSVARKWKGKLQIPENWEVVLVSLTPDEASTVPANSLIKE